MSQSKRRRKSLQVALCKEIKVASLSLKDNSGSVIFSYKLPQAVSRGNILVSSPSLSKGKTATIVYGSNSISNPVFSLWEGVYTTGATLSGGTSTSVTPK